MKRDKAIKNIKEYSRDIQRYWSENPIAKFTEYKKLSANHRSAITNLFYFLVMIEKDKEILDAITTNEDFLNLQESLELSENINLDLSVLMLNAGM